MADVCPDLAVLVDGINVEPLPKTFAHRRHMELLVSGSVAISAGSVLLQEFVQSSCCRAQETQKFCRPPSHPGIPLPFENHARALTCI